MDWVRRPLPDELARRYRQEGFWTDDTFGALLAEHIGQHRDLAFRIHSQTRPWEGTVGEVFDLGRRLASGLRERGIGPQDRVAFQLPNCVEAAAMFYGLSLLGVTLVPIVHVYGPKEVGYVLRESGARVFFTIDRFGNTDYAERLETVLDGTEVELAVVAGQPPAGAVAFDALLDAAPLEGPVPVDPDGIAAIAYTSGTTSNPKGVLHSHQTLLAEVRQLASTRPDDAPPTLVGAPVGHVIGMLSGLLTPPVNGKEINLLDKWDPGFVLELMTRYGLAAGSGSTYFLTSLLDHPDCTDEHVRLMRYVGLGGAPVPQAVAERADALGINLKRGYGSTEHPSTLGSLHSDPREKRLFTDGRATPGVEVRLVDEDGRDVAPGEAGELWSRGPDLCVGYAAPSVTRESFEAEGWYHTGDVGVMDADGFVTITDRVKDIIIRGGENVSAAEVEEVLARLPGVAEVAVVAAPDERYGEHGCAFFRLQSGAEAPTLETLRGALADAGLAKQKWPEEIRVVDAFPRTASGKLQKYVLRQRLRAEAG